MTNKLAATNLWVLGIVLSLLGEDLARAAEGDHQHGPAHQTHEHHGTEGQESRPIRNAEDWWNGAHLAGGWCGGRRWLSDRGADLALVYTGELMSNTRGGANTNGATEYLGSVELTAELNVEKMGGWNGGTFFFYYQHLHGHGVTADHAGAFQAITYLEADPNRYDRLMEYWFRQSFFDDKLAFKAGKMDGNADFAATENGGYFLQSSAGFFPSLAFPSYPDNGLGFALFGKPAEWLTLQAGIFDAAPNSDSISGGPAMLSRDGGHVGLFEAQVHTARWVPGLPGTYRFGAWYSTGGADEVPFFPEPQPGDPPPPALKRFSSNNGLYATFDQMLFKETEDGAQGLSAFFQFAWAPDGRNEVSRYFGGGLVYNGLFPGRDEDVLGVFTCHADFAQRLKRAEDRTHETVIEVVYNAQVNAFLLLQPNYQFVRHPNGEQGARDAHVAGLRWALSF
ncbi:MAG: carbohydrate porin [Planctomycetes bacterium]|nr:carbohydrate porin [Planctomycetota bacterium]